MIRVGITGAIGSGKTTVSRIFESLGVPVYFADQESKRLLNIPYVIQTICKEFGGDILDSNGHINRQKLASLVFSDQQKLFKLNQIMHPLVMNDFDCWLNLHQGSQYTLHEAAILLESGFAAYFSKIIGVSAPEKIRYQRVADRDHVDLNAVMTRAGYQWSEEEKLRYADYVIINDNEHLVIPQVLAVHQKILKIL